MSLSLGALVLAWVLVSLTQAGAVLADDAAATSEQNAMPGPTVSVPGTAPPRADPLAAAEAAVASDPPGYRDAVADAIGGFATGYFEEARADFAHAHALSPSARTLRGLALAEFELRSYVDCMQHLEQALGSRVRPLDGELRTETEHLLVRTRRYVTRIQLTVRPADARIMLDGSLVVKASDKPMFVAAGDHTLELAADGRATQRRRIHALGGDVQALSVLLAEPGQAHERERSTLRNPWFWLSVGTVVVGSALMAGVLIARHGSAERQSPSYDGMTGVHLPGL